MNKTYLFFCIIALTLSSCSVYNSNKLLSDSKEPTYTIEQFQPKNVDETIQPGDQLSIKIYPNDVVIFLRLGSITVPSKCAYETLISSALLLKPALSLIPNKSGEVIRQAVRILDVIR